MSERIELASEAYRAEFMKRLNGDEKYEKLAKKVDDSYTLILQAEPGKGVSETLVIGFTIRHGKMTDIWRGERKTSFILSAPYRAWVDILLGKIGANRAFITRKLKIKGNMPRLLRTAKATDRLVQVLQGIPTKLHGQYEKHSFG